MNVKKYDLMEEKLPEDTADTPISKEDSYEWYLLAKKHFEFLVKDDSMRRKQMTDVINDYEKRHAI